MDTKDQAGLGASPALQLARLLDRLPPGDFTVTVTKPPHPSQPSQIAVQRVQVVQVIRRRTKDEPRSVA